MSRVEDDYGMRVEFTYGAPRKTIAVTRSDFASKSYLRRPGWRVWLDQITARAAYALRPVGRNSTSLRFGIQIRNEGGLQYVQPVPNPTPHR